MNADFRFLWRHREQPQTLKRWVIVWGKRLLLAWALARLLFRVRRLKWRGADIGVLVVMSSPKLGGNYRNLTIGPYSSIGRCEIALHDRVRIGKSVVINDGAILLTASHDLNDPGWRHTKNAIHIGDYAWIATNAIICPGVSIGEGAVVGAGAVVRKDVPPYTVVIGNPAIPLERMRSRQLTYYPTLMNAPLEAWVGRNSPYIKRLEH